MRLRHSVVAVAALSWVGAWSRLALAQTEAPSAPSSIEPSAPAAPLPANLTETEALQEEQAKPALPGGFYSGDAGVSELSEAPRLDLYGFVDLTYTKNLDGPDVPYSRFPHFGSFAIGNLNLYAASTLGKGWRSLIEVRFLYLPGGSDQAFNPGGPVARTNTEVGDYADFQRVLRWGGVEIERVFLEYQASDWLAFQLGQFLTPYGVWNVDHGSPTVIPVRRPFVIGEGLFPERQTGIEVHGALHSGATSYGYHLTFSNGKGPLDAYLDLDSNNALGARLFVRNTSVGNLTVGASGFYGRNTNRNKSYAPKPGVSPPQLEIHDDITMQYDELSLGADVLWEWNDLLAQGELILNQRNYVDPYRRLDSSGVGVVPDERNFGGYALLGYRTPWLGIMPYTLAEYYNFQLSALFPPAISTAFGINIRPQGSVVFKAQYQYTQLGTLSSRELLRGTLHELDFQAAWAF